MPKSSATHENKVNAAVQTLQTTTGVRVPQGMILAGLSADETLPQMVQSRYQQAKITPRVIINNVVIGDDHHFQI